MSQRIYGKTDQQQQPQVNLITATSTNKTSQKSVNHNNVEKLLLNER